MNRPIHILTAIALLFSMAAAAQNDSLPAHVYNLDKLEIKKDSSRDRIQVLDGSTTSLVNLEIHISMLEPGKAPHPPHSHDDAEELVIVKEGNLKATIQGKSKVLGPGGVAMAMPGDEHGFVNAGNTRATYYVIKFKSRFALNKMRADTSGGSVMINWNDVAVQKTDRGVRRDIIERPTALFAKMDVHATTLNQGQVSHAPHTHRQEEIILLRKGDAQMQIGNEFYKATAGDLVFLSSGVLHALKNTGNGECEYFAIQWTAPDK